MKQFKLIFVIWWTGVSCGFSLKWSSSINSIFSSKDFFDLIVGVEENLLESIASGGQIAMNECHTAFYWDRWNCPESDFSRKQKLLVTKEQAVIRSITSAGITYAVAKNCSQGLIPSCGCKNIGVPKYKVTNTENDIYEYLTRRNGTTGVDFVLKGCEPDINFAETVARDILDKHVTGNDIQSKINLHNSLIGRKLIKENMFKKCRCHGISGSCSMQTCWMEFTPFSVIAKQIRNKYHQAKEIKLINDNRRISQDFENKAALIFLGESQSLCFPNNSTGWPGTKGRRCSRTKLLTSAIEERKSCRNLCRTCGYQVRKIRRSKTWSCKCVFNWCCNVECQTCTAMVDEFYCY